MSDWIGNRKQLGGVFQSNPSSEIITLKKMFGGDPFYDTKILKDETLLVLRNEAELKIPKTRTREGNSIKFRVAWSL